MFKADVICIGSATLDNFLTIEVPLSKIKPGDKILVSSLEKHSGGGGTNSAAALAKLGLKVKVLTKLGKDHDADFINEELKQFGIKNLCFHQSSKNTDFSTIIHSLQEKDRIIFVHKGASQDLSAEDFKHSKINSNWLYLATLLGKSFQTAKVIVEIAKKRKIKILFNPSLYLAKKGKKELKFILDVARILVLNKEEAQALLNTKEDSVEKLLVHLQALGPETVIITNGPKKLYALSGKIIYSLMSPAVKVVHTAGAGDAFTSGFLFGMIRNYSLEDALRLGQMNATSVIQAIGTKHKLLNEKEALELMKKYKIKVNRKLV